MGETTRIAWADATFQPWMGCQRVSPGCEHCYAESFSKRVGLSIWGPQASRKMMSEDYWKQPIRWNKKASASGKPFRVFCASLADVFEDRPELVAPRERLFRLIEATPALTWMLLTKQPENIDRLASAWGFCGWPQNIWLGTTVEDQRRAEERVPALLAVHGRGSGGAGPSVRFISCEPLLEPVDLRQIRMCNPTVLDCEGAEYLDALRGSTFWSNGEHSANMMPISWAIIGGESGPHARAFDVQWARSLVAQCREAGMAPFVKQLGANVIDRNEGAPVRVRLRDRAGARPAEWPSDIRVQEFPHA